MTQTNRLYSVRVELPNARTGDPERLRAAMWTAGFRRAFLADGKVTHLPEGGFVISTADSPAAVRTSAQSVATAIDPTCVVRVVPVANPNVSMPSPADDPDVPTLPGAEDK